MGRNTCWAGHSGSRPGAVGGAIATRPASRLPPDWRTSSGTHRTRRRQFVPLTSLGGQSGVVGGDLHSGSLLDHAVPSRTYRFDRRSRRRGTGIVRGSVPRLSDLGRNGQMVSARSRLRLGDRGQQSCSTPASLRVSSSDGGDLETLSDADLVANHLAAGGGGASIWLQDLFRRHYTKVVTW